MSPFERYLTAWVALCIVAGIALGQFFPVPFDAMGGMEIASVNMPVAVLIWLMIIPMLLMIDLGAHATEGLQPDGDFHPSSLVACGCKISSTI